jgi:hypothetical protein
MLGTSGVEVKTTTAAILASGVPVRVFSATWMCGTAGNLILRDGTTNQSQALVNELGTANSSKTVNFEGGLRFASGCYFDKTANVTTAAISFVREV